MVERDERKSFKSVDDLMKNPHYWLSSEIGPKAFGRIFRYLRTREGYSQIDLAAHLHVDDSMLSRIEQGERNPPPKNSFYHRLQTIPGWNEDDVAFLMGTSSHRLLFPEREPKKKPVNIQNSVKLDRITVGISLTADRNIVPKDEQYAIMEMLEPRVRLTLLLNRMKSQKE